MRLIITTGALLALGLARAGAQVPSAPRTPDRVALTARAERAPAPATGARVQASPRLVHALALTGGASRAAAERSFGAPAAERRRAAAARARLTRASTGPAPRKR